MTNMNEEKFQEMLESHDWYYMMSDDHRWYTKGRDEWSAIQNVMNSDKKYHTMYLDYIEKKNMGV